MLGLDEAQWKARRPALTPENEIVLQVWHFCGGWNPEALPLALAYWDVDDAALMLDMLLALRRKIDEHQAAQRGANG